METAFKVAFMLAAAAQIVLIALLVVRALRQRRDGRVRPPVLTGSDVISAAVVFGGTTVITGLAAHGWDGIGMTDLPVYAACIGIVTAGLMGVLRNKSGGRKSTGQTALLVPVAYGVLAGLSGIAA